MGVSETIAPLAEGGDMAPNGEKSIEIGRGARRRRVGVGRRFPTGNGVAVPVGSPI